MPIRQNRNRGITNFFRIGCGYTGNNCGDRNIVTLTEQVSENIRQVSITPFPFLEKPIFQGHESALECVGSTSCAAIQFPQTTIGELFTRSAIWQSNRDVYWTGHPASSI